MARERLVEQAKLQERELLARELHDAVAHHVSAIAIQAQAGLVLARSSSPGGATAALEVIDREAARTLAEMRAMVGGLRDRQSSPSLAPRHRLADIASPTSKDWPRLAPTPSVSTWSCAVIWPTSRRPSRRPSTA